MLNGKRKDMDHVLKNSFESGYTNASLSLLQLTNCKAFFNNLHMGSVRLGSDFLQGTAYEKFTGSYVLLTTEIFGDISGKSYLFLSENAMEILTSSIPACNSSSVNLKEEFIKELDNILSAAVITKLSNALTKKMYGDVPVLIGKVSGHLNDIINDDFSEETEEVYINSIYFSLENHTGIHPLFVWVLDKSTLLKSDVKERE
jgi:chemotaxis protein CheY-P-specific phosphatase CheC